MLYPEVSVEDALRMTVGQAVQQLHKQLPRLHFGHAPALALVRQAACAGVLHLADIIDILSASALCYKASRENCGETSSCPQAINSAWPVGAGSF